MFKKITKYFVKKKNWRKLLIITVLSLGLLSTGYVLAQDFGVEAVETGLEGVLGESGSDPREMAGRIINYALGFLGLIALGIILVAGFKWMTSGGSEEKVAEAKKLLLAGVVGLVIILSSWGLATFILNRFSNVIEGGTTSTIYNEGDTRSCGCGGYMIYKNGSWGECIGGYCGEGSEGPRTCDGSSILAACQPLDEICDANSYCDDNCLCQPKGAAGDSCNLNSDSNVCSADNNLCASYLVCDPDSCLCVGSPVITGISPLGGFCQSDHNRSCQNNFDCNGDICNLNAPNGAAGNFLTIFGKNFSSYVPGRSKVVFLGSGNEKEALNPNDLNPSCVNFWQDDQIVVAIPSGASTGPIKVISADLEDSTNDDYGPKIPDFRANNIIRPGLCEIDPVRGSLSSDVSYQGINLYAGNAYFGSYENNVPGLASKFTNIQGLSGEAKTPNIKAGELGSFVTTSISGNVEKSNYLAFTKDREAGEGAFISSFSPSSGNAGQYVTIFGSGFGASRGSKKVFFGSVEAGYDFPEVCLNSVWKNDQITIKVPPGLEDGYYYISVQLDDKVISTEKINPNTFNFDKNFDLKTSLCKIDPIRGPTNTKVSLWGEYFGASNSEASVKFNGSVNNISTRVKKDGRADHLLVAVPPDAISGPVRVLKSGSYGNELNFSVGDCQSNADCDMQLCCPQGSFKKGQCVNSLDQCFVDVPHSVYEWNFSTGFADNLYDSSQSCAGLASFYGACAPEACPNVPGTCSPYPGGQKLFSSDCSQDCSLTAGCKIGENSCYYDNNNDRCLETLTNEQNYNCDLDKVLEFELAGQKTLANAYCNKDSHWEIIISSSCPEGYTRSLGNRCVDLDSNCSLCDFALKCEEIGGVGRCAAPKICPSGTVCDSVSGSSSGKYKCASIKDASCDCCCTIGQSARDCCAYEAPDGSVVQLECAGTCGNDLINDEVGFGRCSGCASAGETALERDLACNCTGSSGQYCEVNDSSFPEGFCTDCSSLSREGCLEHSAFCCLDSKGTKTTSDDVCRGGAGDLISDDPSSPDYGYCAYYDCLETNPNICATTYPLKIGNYAKLADCEKSCANSDPCSAITDFDSCANEISGRCCFDYKTNTCSLGEAIKGERADKGYCAYYNCGSKEQADTCLVEEPAKDATYSSLGDCNKYCSTPPQGLGLSCSNLSSSACDVSVCNAPGFACLTEGGGFGSMPDCGSCCCQPVTKPGGVDSCKGVNAALSCIANQGDCSGDNRGLCCGCASDSDCGSSEFVGCGHDTCCEARANILSSKPRHLESGVCRNAVLQVKFDQVMDFSSVVHNLLLIEEKDPNTGSCSSGRLIAQADSIDNLFKNNKGGVLASIKEKIDRSWQKIASIFSKKYTQRALANPPSDDKLYCFVPGTVSMDNSLNASTISFVSDELLEDSSNYYLLIKGDEDLNSQTGVVSAKGIGFNGKGYFNPFSGPEGEYVEAENIKFNGRFFKNAEIIKFSTLSSQGAMSGLCDVDEVLISPRSYLFKTTENALPSEENDTPGSLSFDTKLDRDKVFSAEALSADGQTLRPVKGYSWDYDFKISDEKIIKGEKLEGLSSNQYFVSAQSGVVDAESKIEAKINMDRFAGPSCNDSSSCICSDSTCPENCCNLSLGGDGFNDKADVFVFICNNPWPAISANGLWRPWYDSDDNCNIDEGNCSNFNYKFYYCRDSGSDQTSDDLPSILSQALISGQTNSLVCSSDRSVSCNSAGERCGADDNHDGRPDGVCVWGVLKESLFFREELPTSGEIISARDLETGGQIELKWRSGTNQADSYKVYYLRSDQGEMKVKEYKASDVCTVSNQIYNCSTIISNLDNNVSYVFKVGVVSATKAESQAANEKIVIPSDKLAPKVPKGLSVEIVNDKVVKVSWDNNRDDTSFYRLYRGLKPGLYGESYDSPKGIKDDKPFLNFLVSDFSAGANYFALSAIDHSANESDKSLEFKLDIPANIFIIE